MQEARGLHYTLRWQLCWIIAVKYWSEGIGMHAVYDVFISSLLAATSSPISRDAKINTAVFSFCLEQNRTR